MMMEDDESQPKQEDDGADEGEDNEGRDMIL